MCFGMNIRVVKLSSWRSLQDRQDALTVGRSCAGGIAKQSDRDSFAFSPIL